MKKKRKMEGEVVWHGIKTWPNSKCGYVIL